MQKLDLQTLKSWLWESVNILRGSIESSDYINYIFRILFLKRFNDIFEERIASIMTEKVIDREKAIDDLSDSQKLPDIAQWDTILSTTENIGDYLDKAFHAIEVNNIIFEGVLTSIQFGDNNRLSDDVLFKLLSHFNKFKLNNNSINNEDILGYACDHVIKMIVDVAGRIGGEFYTPSCVVKLLVSLIDPKPGMSIYDPTEGLGGMLLESAKHIKAQENGSLAGGVPNCHIAGQELNNNTWAISRLNLYLHNIDSSNIKRGDTLSDPQHVNNGSLEKFDRVIANPPIHIKMKPLLENEYDVYKRFIFGSVPIKNADFAFIQHMIASLKPNGKMAVVVAHNVLFQNGFGEQFRHDIIESDILEAVIGLPPNLNHHTSIPVCILIFNRNKIEKIKNNVLFINANKNFTKNKRINTIDDIDQDKILEAYNCFSDVEQFSRVVSKKEIELKLYNLNIPRYVDSSDLAKFIVQYDDKYKKLTINDVKLEVNIVPQNKSFVEIENSIYIPKVVSKKRPITDLNQLEHHHNYFQVVLNNEILNEYLANYLGTSIGQKSLSFLITTSMRMMLRKIDLLECFVPVPDLEIQQKNIITHHKLLKLKETLNDIDKELTLYPTKSSEFETQIDKMLDSIDKLSDGERFRSLINNGESKTVEFKQTLTMDTRNNKVHRGVEESVFKNLVAFLNTNGGTLFVGIKDDKEILGISSELENIFKDETDKMFLFIKDKIKKRIGLEFTPLISYKIVDIESRNILIFECTRSEIPCFLDKTDFYIRVNPAAEKLEAQKLFDYQKQRF